MTKYIESAVVALPIALVTMLLGTACSLRLTLIFIGAAVTFSGVMFTALRNRKRRRTDETSSDQQRRCE